MDATADNTFGQGLVFRPNGPQLSQMSDPYFFGYGSLVNRSTHRYDDCHHATLQGWHRVWRHSTSRPVAILTAEPKSGVQIGGLIAAVPNADWQELDTREVEYDRVDTDGKTTHGLNLTADIQTYMIPEKPMAQPILKPIPLSYLDVVVQGYFREFGEVGVQQFFATTSGWDAPINNDRSNPIYPRHRVLTPHETALVDRMIAQVNGNVIQ